jgi:hypothetical protein
MVLAMDDGCGSGMGYAGSLDLEKRKCLCNAIHMCRAIVAYNSDKFNLITDDHADE